MLCHPRHGACYDFRPRLETTLLRPSESRPEVDWEGWLAACRAGPPGPYVTLDVWAAGRAASLNWLRSLDAPDWYSTHQARQSPIRGCDVLAVWPAHDILQQRHPVRLRHRCVAELPVPYGLRCASEW